MRALLAPVLFLCLLAPLHGGCATAGPDLESARALYKDARYEAAAQWLADLEHRTDLMDEGQRATYFYLRGMTDYRLGRRDHALHFLALCMAVAGPSGDLLSPSNRLVMDRTLAELMPTDASPHARNPLRPDTL